MSAVLKTPQSGAPPRTALAYLINTYPAVSHTFIRREIEALERLDWKIHRFAIRKPQDLVDPRDIAEAAGTESLLPLNPARLIGSHLAALRHPLLLLRACRAALSMAWVSDRPLLRTLAVLPEAILLTRRLRRLGVRHVHGHFGTNAAALLRVMRALGGPSYSFTVHGPDEFDQVPGLSLAGKIRDAGFVVAITRFARAQLLRWTPPDMWDKVHIVRCGLPLEDLPAPTPVPDTNQLLCIGRLCEQKGHVVLVRAAGRLARSGVPLSIVLAGDGPMRPDIEREIRRQHLESVVRITGWLSNAEIQKLLAASRGLVLPSFAEGLPIVFLEAYRAGRPIVTTPVGGITELVRPGISGWLVPPGDEQALADALRDLLQRSPVELAGMAAAGRKLVETWHDADIEAGKLSRLFDATLQDMPLSGVAELSTAAELAAPEDAIACAELRVS